MRIICMINEYQTCGEKDVAGSGVPADDAHAFGVALQHHDGLANGPGWGVVWDLPYLPNSEQ